MKKLGLHFEIMPEEDYRLSQKWWNSLSMNQMDEYAKKYFPETWEWNGHSMRLYYLSDIQRPTRVWKIWKGEGRPLVPFD